LSDCRCGGGGWYGSHAADCTGDRASDWAECCFYRETYCDCPAGDRLRAHDGAEPRQPPKGYSPLRRWLREERARANQRYVRTGPLVLGFEDLASLEERIRWMTVRFETWRRSFYGVNNA